jgi:outer membrane receptor for ferric coprogen and ferric-rhodotorulic acid
MSAVNWRMRSLLSKMSQRSLSFSSPLVLLGALGMAPLAYAEAVKLNIPSQSLASALREFGLQSGMQVLYEPTLVEGKRAGAVSGQMESVTGLERILSGTGISYRVENGVVFLSAPSADSSALELGATSVTGLMSVATEETGSYTTPVSTMGKSPMSLKETPQTVSVMTRQRMEDQSLTTLSDVMNQTTGITMYQGSMNASRYMSRGFEVTSFRVDGGAPVTSSAYAWKDLDMAIFDRVEVLRGSDALYSGNGEPGGGINLVRKRPTAEPKFSITNSIGSWQNYRTELDVSGPLGFDGKLRGRSVIVYQDKDYFYEKGDSDRKLFYGVLEADLTDDTTLLVGMTNDHVNASDQSYGLPRYSNGNDLKLPRNTYLAGANDYFNRIGQSYFLRVDHTLNDSWSATLDTLYAQTTSDRSYYNFAGEVDPATGAGVSSRWFGAKAEKRDISLDLNIKGGGDVFDHRNDLLLGWSWQKSAAPTALSRDGVAHAIDNIFAFDPDDFPSYKENASLYLKDHTDVVQNGLYASWRLQLTEPLHVIVGGRYSNYKYRYATTSYATVVTGGPTNVTSYKDNDVITPFVGLTYDLNPDWTAYASVSEIYKSQANYRKTGDAPLKPITGINHEVGVKGELMGGRFNTYAALYYVKRDGEAVRDVSTGPVVNGCCYKDDGQIVSKGVDFEISGELLERLNGTFGYTYNHNENKLGGTSYITLTPRHLAKVFGSYQLPGALSDFKVGGGVTAQSATYVSYPPTEFKQAGYAIWNGFAEYQVNKEWSVALNANNLFDKKYYSTVGYSDYGNFYGDPKNFTLTLRGSY